MQRTNNGDAFRHETASGVEVFGEELLVEYRAALKQREELEVAAPADDYVDT